MMVSDPIADMLTRIRNATMARHESCEVPASKIKLSIAKILKDEGFIQDFEVNKEKDRPELDCIENLCPVCHDCHEYSNGWAVRVAFWKSQVQLYGADRMREWLDGLNLKAPPKFE